MLDLSLFDTIAGSGKNGAIVHYRAKKENCRIVWTMPRKSALFAYENVGFHKIGKWIDEGVEFGPNCVAINEIL